MSTEFNLCPKCGGVKSLKQPEQTGWVRTSTFKACSCQTESKHEGKISDFYEAHITSHQRMVFIGNGGHLNDHIELTPAQALSLLAWLIQERETLQRLAKEQEDGK